ncbi:linoleate 13S-lipoxygenase 3-1, chloroplastic-like [Gastrolobium bilobum]|uniref:linoleate 13S-lipoxygenase 3-1, chloroplastic-like n=1 Tax=Gastrolobium bilobum TaxID=150636 RepID=UPI002AB09468|nr:linoleate 13S-lipoxygenase 3-1, chloroplastic-like [Gastrolobium bilobum]
MALVNEIMGSSCVERSSFVSSSFSKVLLRQSLQQKQNRFFVSPVFVPLENTRFVRLRKAAKFPVAAISEDLMKDSSSSSSSVPAEKPVKFKVRAVVTVRNKIKEDFKETIFKHLDALTEMIGRNVVLELVSTEIDPKTKAAKKSNEAVLKDWSKKSNVKAERVNYTAEFIVDSSFGEPGAITVTNKHQKELFLESITIEGFASGPVHFPCNSWVQARKDHPGKRIFFSNKPYLPGDTPAGLRLLREKELRNLRGDCKGVRNLCDRIYDYDTYNDLGNPDKGVELVRPTLGGSEMYPYPRRCRTGRAPSDTDMYAESRVEKPLPMYVPRDERFEESKQNTFSVKRLKAVLHNLIPSLKASLSANNQDFNEFSDVDGLYSEGLLIKFGLQDDVLKRLPLPNVVSKIQESSQGLLKYDTPKIISKDKFAWLRDDEFGRQALAGINPVNIERLKVFPPVSKLDPEIYGPQESALKEEHILSQLNGMTVQQAIEENKLFIIDYHDVYLPFLEGINALDGRKSYATRTIFFLTSLGTLKPVAIELSLPPAGPSSRSKRVVTPPIDATTNWIWQLAKAHVCSNDAGVHQLVNHWLRTHACLEPFILAAHRQLSAMHPIFKLLDPHMRYTLEINALARQSLIHADGIIESSFTPGRYSMEISSAAYKNFWRFDMDSLPADLIRRGMAVPDPTQPHGLKLVMEDYPYASDGLLIWSAIENWVRTYVNHYYPHSSLICNDKELQAWYSESINVGHADLRHESWWPTLNNSENLVSIISILIWNASAQHAALNFGQYPYGGYVPNRPPLMRRLIPQESDPEYTSFLADPQKYFLNALPSLLQATKFMAVVDTLSTHSPDEEYLGERQQPSIWSGDAEIIEAFYDFSAKIRQIEKVIDSRNCDRTLRNRCGAGVLPYELLAPSSEPGVTCRGVPNSVST